MSVPADIDLDAEVIPSEEADHFSYFDPGPPKVSARDEAEAIDAEIVDHSRLKSDPDERFTSKKDEKAKASAPRLDEWQDFFSRVLIRSVTDFYVDRAFRGIDEDWLSDSEIERIHLREAERNRIAKPFAELAHRTKIIKKHGRAIISLSDSIDSIITLGMWFSRVNRIAAKYHERAEREYGYPRPAPVIRMPVMTPHEEEGYDNGSFGQSTPEGTSRGGNTRPTVPAAPIFSPGG